MRRWRAVNTPTGPNPQLLTIAPVGHRAGMNPRRASLLRLPRLGGH